MLSDRYHSHITIVYNRPRRREHFLSLIKLRSHNRERQSRTMNSPPFHNRLPYLHQLLLHSLNSKILRAPGLKPPHTDMAIIRSRLLLRQ